MKVKNTAASVLCTLSTDILSMMPEIIGVVALLGSVNTDSLSRMLAEYLGEDFMVAVVCKSYAGARCFESYSESGELDPAGGLHILQAELGHTIDCQFLVICLEDLCPYNRVSKSNDPQKKLSVNLINIDIRHLHTKTSKGYDLRETLFYTLLGELQVYGTRKQMHEAHELIKHGVISLDGGMIKGSGIHRLGPCKEPGVRFPVVNFEGHPQLDPDIAKKLEDKKLELGETSAKLVKMSKDHDKAKKRFGKKMESLSKRTNELEPFKELLPFGSCTNVNRQLFK